MYIHELDKKTRQLAKNYLRFEKELLHAIILMDKIKGYFKLGFGSLHEYCTKALELSPAQAYSFINVARKSHEVPELKKSGGS